MSLAWRWFNSETASGNYRFAHPVATAGGSAQLAPDPIPLFVIEEEKAQELWQEAIAVIQQEVRASAGTTVEMLDALATLANYSMVEWDTEKQTVNLHRVVQEILRNRLPEAWRKAWLTFTSLSARKMRALPHKTHRPCAHQSRDREGALRLTERSAPLRSRL